GGNLFDQYASVPTAQMRTGDFSSTASIVRDPLSGLPFPGNAIPVSRVNPVALNLLPYLPLPNGPGYSRNFHQSASNRSTQDTLNLRLTRPFGASASARPVGRGNASGQAAQ